MIIVINACCKTHAFRHGECQALICWSIGFHLECYNMVDIEKEIIKQCPMHDKIIKRNMRPSPQPENKNVTQRTTI